VSAICKKEALREQLQNSVWVGAAQSLVCAVEYMVLLVFFSTCWRMCVCRCMSSLSSVCVCVSSLCSLVSVERTHRSLPVELFSLLNALY
jgi:hypothetical protein